MRLSASGSEAISGVNPLNARKSKNMESSKRSLGMCFLSQSICSWSVGQKVVKSNDLKLKGTFGISISSDICV